MKPIPFYVLGACGAIAFSAPAASNTTSKQNDNGCGIDARMMRYPDVSAKQIAFVYAGDIWVAPKTGGAALRLSSPRGEETFPRFSPDGTEIAFSGNYDGNTDIHVGPSTGGLPARRTPHAPPERRSGWEPDAQTTRFAGLCAR